MRKPDNNLAVQLRPHTLKQENSLDTNAKSFADLTDAGDRQRHQAVRARPAPRPRFGRGPAFPTLLALPALPALPAPAQAAPRPPPKGSPPNRPGGGCMSLAWGGRQGGTTGLRGRP